MAHNPDAKQLITDSFKTLEPFARAICERLRIIIHTAEPNIIEDWKWGPNFYLDGMLCSVWGFKKHVTLTFFQGALLKDKKKILLMNPGNVHNRNIKFYKVEDIDEKTIIEYIMEAVTNNKKGLKVVVVDKTVLIPDDLKKMLKKHNVLKTFDSMSYSHKKEYLQWIEDAKKEETRTSRINKTIERLSLAN